jgi:hypothetical protein
VNLVFIPGGRTTDEATIVTDSFAVRRSPAGARRVLLRGAAINVNRAKKPGDKRMRGYLIISRGKEHADTLYDDLGGLDVGRLMLSLAANREKLGGKKP